MSASSKLKALASNLAVLLVGIVAALLLLEGALRLYNPFQTRIKGDRIALTANTRNRYRTSFTRDLDKLDREITVSRNALGFRGPDPPADFANRLTLITIGGSTTRCGMQTDEKTWTAHLGRLLDQSLHDVWINNAGLDGHTTNGHLVLLQDHIVKLHPKVVLFMVGVNDIIVGPGTERDAENIRSPIMFGSFKSFVKSLSAYSEVVAVSLDLFRSAVAHQKGLGYHQGDLARSVDFEATPDQEREDRETFAGPGRLADFRARLLRLIALARSASIEPVFLTQPLLAGRCRDDVTGRDLGRIMVTPGRNGGMLWDLQQAYNDVTRSVCQENDVFLIDLAVQIPKTSRYFFDFMHFNNDGTVLVAETIYRSLCPHLAGRYPAYVLRPCAPPGPPPVGAGTEAVAAGRARPGPESAAPGK
jgi:lysophospholipase L1-like esterase